MTLREIKKLRLVCKSLDRAFAPIVLSNIHVFHRENWRGRVRPPTQHDGTCDEIHQLFTLLRKSDQLSHVRSLTLHSWDWLLRPYRRSSAQPTTGVTSMCKQLAQLMTWPIFPFLGYLVLSQHIGPRSLLPRLYRGTSISAQFQNVTSVK